MMKRPFVPAALLFVALLLPAGAMAGGDPDGPGAMAACRKHVESMLRDAAATSYDEGMRIERVDTQTVQVLGGVTSRSVAGAMTRADFRCQAKRHGLIWTTRTELTMDR